MTKENLINLINNKKPVELVQEANNKYEVPSYEEFMKTYEHDDNLNYDDLRGGSIGEAKRYGPMPKLWRDVACFYADFSSEVNHWLYRGLFQYDNGTIESCLSLQGIDEMKDALRKLENGTIKVVRRKQYDRLSYEPCKTREEEVKEMLRKKIASLENDYSYSDEKWVQSTEIGSIIQR